MSSFVTLENVYSLSMLELIGMEDNNEESIDGVGRMGWP